MCGGVVWCGVVGGWVGGCWVLGVGCWVLGVGCWVLWVVDDACVVRGGVWSDNRLTRMDGWSDCE